MWEAITSASAHLECLALLSPAWGRAILYREIKTLDRLALHLIEPIEAAGQDVPVFLLRRTTGILRRLEPLAMLVRQSEMEDWSSTIDRLQNVLLITATKKSTTANTIMT